MPLAKCGHCGKRFRANPWQGNRGRNPVYCSCRCATTATAFARFGRFPESFWAKMDIRGPDDCWNWTACKTTTGYGMLGHRGDGKHRWRAHRMAYFLTHGKIPKGMCVLHRCDNRLCCNPKHLWLGTYKDNARDMWAKGRAYTPRPQGEEHGMHKLRESDVIKMHAEHQRGIPAFRLAKTFHISHAHACRILSYGAWSYLKGKI